MFHFFNNKIGDLSQLKIDMHNHLLPAIDDGSDNMEESKVMSKQLAAWGIEEAIYTPHVYSYFYANTPQKIQKAFKILTGDYEQFNTFKTHRFAAEYMLDDSFSELLKKDEPLLCLKDNLVLVEFPLIFQNTDTDVILFNLFISGYQPVIAHPERYAYFHSSLENYKRLKNMGCYLQMNLLSIVGYYGHQVKVQAEKLLQHDLIDFVSTDIHKPKQLNIIELILKSSVWRKYQNYNFKNTFFIDKR